MAATLEQMKLALVNDEGFMQGQYSDELLQQLLDEAAKKIAKIKYWGDDMAAPTDENGELSLDLSFDGTQLSLAIEALNKQGAEGEISHSENGVSRSWSGGSASAPVIEDVIPKGGVL